MENKILNELFDVRAKLSRRLLVCGNEPARFVVAIPGGLFLKNKKDAIEVTVHPNKASILTKENAEKFARKAVNEGSDDVRVIPFNDALKQAIAELQEEIEEYMTDPIYP